MLAPLQEKAPFPGPEHSSPDNTRVPAQRTSESCLPTCRHTSGPREALKVRAPCLPDPCCLMHGGWWPTSEWSPDTEPVRAGPHLCPWNLMPHCTPEGLAILTEGRRAARL